jgi:hypothetical protein
LGRVGRKQEVLVVEFEHHAAPAEIALGEMRESGPTGFSSTAATTSARIPLWSMPVAGATTNVWIYVNMEPYDWRGRSPGFPCCCKWKRKSIRATYNVMRQAVL